MALVHAEPRCCASSSCCCAAASSSKATCSTGGIRRRAAACARASPTTTSGCRSRSRATSRATGDAGVLDEQVPFLEGRPVQPDDESYYDLPHASDDAATPLRALRARDPARAALRRARPAADGQRRLERRHEPASARTAAAKASGSASSCATVLDAVRRRSRALRGDAGIRGALRGEAARASRQHRGSTAGTARGTGARYFDDGTPLGSAANAECQIDSIAQSWAVLSGAGERERVAHGDGRASTRIWSARRGARPAARPAVRPVDARTPATSGLRAAACAKTAASTRTARSGRRWRSRALGDCERAWELFAHDQPGQSRRTHARAIARYKIEPYVVAADVYASRRTPAAAAGRGTRARQAGCTG